MPISRCLLCLFVLAAGPTSYAKTRLTTSSVCSLIPNKRKIWNLLYPFVSAFIIGKRICFRLKDPGGTTVAPHATRIIAFLMLTVSFECAVLTSCKTQNNPESCVKTNGRVYYMHFLYIGMYIVYTIMVRWFLWMSLCDISSLRVPYISTFINFFLAEFSVCI